MNKSLRDMDEIFNSAYKQFAEDPPPNAWDQINASLDKKDASVSKRKLKNWKRVSLLSWFLLGGFILFEAAKLIITRSDVSTKPVAVSELNAKKVAAKETNPAEVRSNDLQTQTSMEETGSVSDLNAHRVERDLAPREILNHSTVAGLSRREGKVLFGAIVPGGKNNTEGQQQRPTVPFLLSGQEQDLNSDVRIASLKNDLRSFPASTAAFLDEYSPLEAEHSHSIILQSELAKGDIPKAKINNVHRSDFRWAISGFLSSDHPGYRLDKDGPTLVRIKQHEQHESSYSAGILISRQLTHRLSLQTGVFYSDIGIAISPEQIYASVNSAGHVLYKYVVSSGYAYIKPKFAAAPSPGDSLTAEDSQHSLQYIVTPLLANYKLVDRAKFIFSAGIGIAGNYLTSATIEAEVAESFNREHVSIRRLEGIRSFSLSVMGNLSLEYLATKRVSISLRPFFSYALSPITNNNDVETFPYNIGVGAGVSYRF